MQEFVRSHNKEGKTNYYRVIYENTKIDQSRRKPMQVYNVVKRKFYPVDPDFGCQGHKLDHVAGIPEDTNGVGTFPDQKQTPKV